MADYRSPSLQIPHRKPLPSANAGLQFNSSSPSPGSQHRSQQAMRPHAPQNRPQVASSSYVPNPVHPQKQMAPVYPPQQMNPNFPVRRSSNATTSTASTGGNAPTHSGHSNVQADVRRSSSSRSGASPLGYVALMRKQKATVWCDRAQQEDPRVAAQRRAAKQRAALEVHGGGSRSGTLGSSGKIRHNASARSMSYNTGTMVGAGVPLRLSANEVGDGEDDDNDGPAFHRRTGTTGSGRSSTGSNRFPSGYQRPQQGRFSSSSNTPPNTDPADRQNDIPEIVETPAPIKPNDEKEYFPSSANGSAKVETSSTGNKSDRPSTAHSYDSSTEENFGTVTDMAAPSGAVAATNRAKTADDLRRRGSVDDRSTSMSSVRLYVANPDLSD
ncbi:hypothetical protein AJ79_03965 [Helicocarpus griseus UAMH5409]|uniref:Uncharacterized protein n=1 Tax=Helicocarpus griseus UAMH5409 TaxID=1447875 RepID=A0A2B7XWI6_9EURO|nr:hypothetical protein AJ79_03965 [Helicocarpus griseus UAMH5409]